MTSFSAIALLDTGATVSGVGPNVIAELGLRSHGKKRLLSATEEAFVSYYLFRIGIQASEATSAWPFVFDTVDGFSWGRPADFDVILGMDILSQCDVLISRNGTCRLSFG